MAVDLEDEAPQAAAEGVKTTRITGWLKDATGILVIDVSNLAYRASYGNPSLSNSKGEFTGHVFGALRSLLAVLQNHLSAGAWLPVFCYDGSHSKDERRAIVPSYKANRDPNRFDPVPGVSAALRTLPGFHVLHPYREGDDAMAWVVEKIGRKDREVVVYSGDKDTWTLMKHRGVKVLSPNLDRFVTEKDVLEEFHTTPDRIPLSKAFHGDPSDEVKGVNRLLRKVMAPYINMTEDVDVLQVYDLVRCDSTLPVGRAAGLKKALKLLAKIEPEYDRVCANFRVVTANTTGFTTEHFRAGLQDKEQLTGALERMECKTLLERVDDFFGAEMFLQHE